VRLYKDKKSVTDFGKRFGSRNYSPRLQVLFHHLTVEEDEQGARDSLLRYEASEANAAGVVIVHFQIFPDHSSRVGRGRILRSPRRRRRSRERSLARTPLLLHRHGLSVLVWRGILLRQVDLTSIREAFVKRTHHQRVPRGAGVLLDQERGPERLAEESLTLLRDVVRGVSAVLLRGHAVVLRSHARRRRWG
jgi:hypothetical protein